MFNKTILLGNLTKDIEMRFSQSSVGISNCSIATSYVYIKNGENGAKRSKHRVLKCSIRKK